MYCIKKSSANKLSLRSNESSHHSRVLASDSDENLLLKILNVYYIRRLCLEDGYFLFITVYEYFSDLVSKRCCDALQYDRVNKSPIFVKDRLYTSSVSFRLYIEMLVGGEHFFTVQRCLMILLYVHGIIQFLN